MTAVTLKTEPLNGKLDLTGSTELWARRDADGGRALSIDFIHSCCQTVHIYVLAKSGDLREGSKPQTEVEEERQVQKLARPG